MSGVNIFTGYKQEEDQFTNGLIALLQIASSAHPNFSVNFLRDLVGVELEEISSYRVLRGIEGTADAELRGSDWCIQFETKVASATLRQEQLNGHLAKLSAQHARQRLLVLLTPDDGGSHYIQRHINIAPKYVRHLAWKSVYGYLEKYLEVGSDDILAELIRQYLNRIEETVFQQDIVGIILKTDFGKKSGVFADAYLQEIGGDGWTSWNTPAEYKNLDGTGRKLLLYDRTRKGITAEVQIRKITRTDEEPDYPWSNEFEPGTLRIFEPPILVDLLRTVPNFENFGVYRKDRSAYRNITSSEYRQLMEQYRQDDFA